jgi:RNA polymerase sigma-70 factor (ECF subfamily)
MVSRELLEAARRRDPGAFEELVERTHRRVYTLAYRLVGDRHEAEDVAQEAYLRAYRALPGFRGESRFETWLYRITANTAMNHLRRRGRFGDVLAEDDERVVRVEDPSRPALDDVVERDEIERALGTLPAGQRAVVLLKDVYGFSCAEIGEHIGISEGAVKVRLHRARRRLKEQVYGPDRGHEAVGRFLPEYAEDRDG